MDFIFFEMRGLIIRLSCRRFLRFNFWFSNFSVENLEHCDFIALRNIVIRTHLQDLKDVTNNVHYENYRCRKLAGLGVDGKQSRLSNKWVDIQIHFVLPHPISFSVDCLVNLHRVEQANGFLSSSFVWKICCAFDLVSYFVILAQIVSVRSSDGINHSETLKAFHFQSNWTH